MTASPCLSHFPYPMLLLFYVALALVLFHPASLALSSNTSLPTGASSSGYVLVLGSGGLIGSALSEWLHRRQYRTVLVHNRSHVDLRDPAALPSYLSSLSIPPSSISYAFFLACEVGGSKFLQSPSATTRSAILQHNLALYHSVLPFLSSHSIPFLFTSSYLSHMNTPYGSIKRVGEQLTALLPLSRTLRLWNVYGREAPSLKAHVLTDWTTACLASHLTRSTTDGWEWRQFIHAADVAEAMGLMMGRWQGMDAVTDLSSGEWVRMREVGAVVEEVAGQEGGGCRVEFSDGVQGDRMEGGAVRERVDPNMTSAWWRETGWKPRISMVEGVRDLFRYYGRILPEGERSMRASGVGGLGNETAMLVFPRSSAPPYAVRSAFAVRT